MVDQRRLIDGLWYMHPNSVTELQAETERLRAERKDLIALTRRAEMEAEIERLRAALIEIRLRLHAADRRPEECYEMSLIDDALRAKG